MLTEQLNREQCPDSVEIEIPAPTAWPFVLAFGSTLMLTGLLTSCRASVRGFASLLRVASDGFARSSRHRAGTNRAGGLEDESRLTIAVSWNAIPIAAGSSAGMASSPYISGFSGGQRRHRRPVAMAALAALMDSESRQHLVSHQSPCRGDLSRILASGPHRLYSFHADAFAVAFVLHGVGSILVGLLYGAMLPMFPRRPIVLGGLIAPVCGRGCFTNSRTAESVARQPHQLVLVRRLASGFWSCRRPRCRAPTRIPTRENLSFALRAGIEAPGIYSDPRRGTPMSRIRHPVCICRSPRLYFSRLAALRTVNLRWIQRYWHRSRLWTSALSTHRTAPPAMARKDGRSSIALANPVYLAIADEARCTKLSPTGFREPRCRRSRRVPEDC